MGFTPNKIRGKLCSRTAGTLNYPLPASNRSYARRHLYIRSMTIRLLHTSVLSKSGLCAGAVFAYVIFPLEATLPPQQVTKRTYMHGHKRSLTLILIGAILYREWHPATTPRIIVSRWPKFAIMP